MTYGVKLRTEVNGWRIGFDNVDPRDTKALSNRIIYQTACRAEEKDEAPESDSSDSNAQAEEEIG